MTLNLAAIFGAGLLTFVTPCVLPLVPLYLAALAGGDLRRVGSQERGQLLVRALSFSAGFVAVFVLLGLVASSIGALLSAHRVTFQIVGGIVILIFGLKFLGLIEVPLLDRVLRADDLAFRAIDINDPVNRHLIDRHRLVGVPTFLFLDTDQNEVARLVGRQSQQTLHQALSAVRGESCADVGALPTDDPAAKSDHSASEESACLSTFVADEKGEPTASACSVTSP